MFYSERQHRKMMEVSLIYKGKSKPTEVKQWEIC